MLVRGDPGGEVGPSVILRPSSRPRAAQSREPEAASAGVASLYPFGRLPGRGRRPTIRDRGGTAVVGTAGSAADRPSARRSRLGAHAPSGRTKGEDCVREDAAAPGREPNRSGLLDPGLRLRRNRDDSRRVGFGQRVLISALAANRPRISRCSSGVTPEGRWGRASFSGRHPGRAQRRAGNQRQPQQVLPRSTLSGVFPDEAEGR